MSRQENYQSNDPHFKGSEVGGIDVLGVLVLHHLCWHYEHVGFSLLSQKKFSWCIMGGYGPLIYYNASFPLSGWFIYPKEFVSSYTYKTKLNSLDFVLKNLIMKKL